MDIVHKKAPGARVEGLTFVLSDATVDRYGDVVEPRGWDLRNFNLNPIALFNHNSDFPIGKWKNLRVENEQLVGDLEPARQGTSDRIDELLSLIEQGILRATSVGFRPIESEPRQGGKGMRYKRQELLETSVVSVPALPTAIAVARSMNISPETMAMAFGEQADGRQSVPSRSLGVNAAPRNVIAQEKKMTTLNERIQAAQDDLVRERDALTAHLAEDDADPIVTEELSARIEQKQTGVDALKRAEAVLAAKTAAPAQTVPAMAQRRPEMQKGAKPADLIIRSAVVNAVAFASNKAPEEVLERLYGNDEATGIIVKAAVAPATTTTSGWAAELVNTAMTEFLETLRPMSVYPELAAAGGGRLSFGPNQGAIKIPARAPTPSIGGSFIGEGAPIPVRRLALTSATLSPKKLGVITTFTREIARYSTPAIEGILRNEILADTAITLDSILLDNVAGDAIRPAGLLNGVTAITATTGGGQAAILADIRKLRAPFDAANNGTNLVLLMNPAQEVGLALTPAADGQLGWTSSVLSRYKIITSTAIPVGRVIMVNAGDFVTATGDVPEFEMSNEATLHMEDSTPLQIGSTGTPNTVAAPVRSLFQTATMGLRMLMDVSWSLRRPGSVQWIDGVTW